MADGEVQVVLSDDFESGALTDTDRWTVVTGSAGTITNGIATIASAQTEAIAWHSDKVPQTPNQHLQASVVCHEDGTNIDVSLMARLDSSVTAASFQPTLGYLMRLSYEPAGVRNLEFIRYARAAGGPTEISLTSVAVTNNMTQVSSTDEGVLQDIRFTVTNEDAGVRLRGFVNNDDDLNPTLSYLDLGTDTGTALDSVTTKAAGVWGFYLRGNAGEIGVDLFEAYDKYAVPVTDPNRGRTLEELRDRLKNRVARGGNTTLANDVLDEWINDAQYEVMNELGHLALFTEREGTMTFDSIDQGRTIEVGRDVESLIQIMEDPSRRNVEFTYIGPNEKNTAQRYLIGQNPGTNTFIVRYHLAWTDMQSDEERCIVPRRYDEAVLLASVLRLAERQGDQSWYQTTMEAYSRAMIRMKRNLNRMKGEMKTRLRVRPIRNVLTRGDRRYVASSEELPYGYW